RPARGPRRGARLVSERFGKVELHLGDNLDVLRAFPSGSFSLIYIDPPFNTGKAQARARIRVEPDAEGDRVGFKGTRYRSIPVADAGSYGDRYDDYLAFLGPRLEEAQRLLSPTGSLFVHLDYREVHYVKVALDQLFGRKSFINEII